MAATGAIRNPTGVRSVVLMPLLWLLCAACAVWALHEGPSVNAAPEPVDVVPEAACRDQFGDKDVETETIQLLQRGSRVKGRDIPFFKQARTSHNAALSQKHAVGAATGQTESKGPGPTARLAMVLLQAFFAILMGMLIIRTGALQPSQTVGISFIVGRVALPLIIFQAVATMDFSILNLQVLKVMIASKLLIQVFTMVVSMLLTYAAAGSKRNSLATRGQCLLNAGIYGFFVTASDDLAFGLPIVAAVFPVEQYPQNFVAHLLGMAVCQTLVMNTVALLVLELGDLERTEGEKDEASTTTSTSARMSSLLGKVFKQMARNLAANPLLQMVFAGLVFKLIFHDCLVHEGNSWLLPMGLRDIVAIAISPFRFLALMLLGLRLGAQTHMFSDPWPTLIGVALMVLKVFVMALLMRAMVGTIDGLSADEQKDFENFADLFGGLPTSAAPVIFAGMYRVAEDVVPPAVIIGVVISGPVLFVKAMLLAGVGDDSVAEETRSVFTVLSVLGTTGAAVVLLLFTLARDPEWRRYPRNLFAHYVFAVLMAGIMRTVLYNAAGTAGAGCDQMPAFVFFARAYFRNAARVWSVMFAGVLAAVGMDRPLQVPLGSVVRAFHKPILLVAYLLPLLPALTFGIHDGQNGEGKGPLPFSACDFGGGEAQARLDIQICVGLLFVLILGVTLGLALVPYQQSQADADADVDEPATQDDTRRSWGSWVSRAPAPANATSSSLQEASESLASNPQASSLGRESRFNVDTFHIHEMHSLDVKGVAENAAELTEEEWHTDKFVVPVAAISLFAFCNLTLQCVTAMEAFRQASSSRSALALVSLVMEVLSGSLIFLLFGCSTAAMRGYGDIATMLATPLRCLYPIPVDSGDAK